MDFVARFVLLECQARGLRGFTVAYRLGGRLVTAPPGSSQQLSLLLLLYADDVVLLAPSAEDLRQTLLVFESVTQQWGLQMSYSKTKAMEFAAQP